MSQPEGKGFCEPDVQDSSGARSWDAIQKSLRLYDDHMMKDYADDIDALLTFAGLFSAALTAFLLPTTARLQADNSQTTVQLLSILVLRDATPSEATPFLNSTATSLPRSASFEVPASAVAVNTLWFLSLIFSLSSALFGILAKQWCREYLRWHSALSPARENILLRQLRFEAWEDWYIPSLITTIPALLELALVLFFIGLVVYSRTLQRTVFGFVLLAVLFVLCATITLTLLPTFSRRCPYKSPTGWAFNRLAHLLRRQSTAGGNRFRFLRSLSCFRRTSPSKFPAQPEILRDWRSWDLRLTRDPNLCKCPGLLHPHGSHDQPEAEAVTDASALTLLLRALSWVRRGSNDVRLLGHIDDCLRTLYDNVRTHEDSRMHFHVTVYPLRLAMGWMDNNFEVEEALKAQFVADRGAHDTNRGLEILRLRSKPHGRWRAQAGPYLTDMSPDIPTCDPVFLSLCRKAVTLLLERYVGKWMSSSAESGESNAVLRSSWTRKVIKTIAMLRYLPRDYLVTSIENSGSDLDVFSNSLFALYTRLAPLHAAHSDGLAPMMLDLLRLMGVISFPSGFCDPHFTAVRLVTWLCVQNCEIAPLNRFLEEINQSGQGDERRLHAFVIAVSNALVMVQGELSGWHEPNSFSLVSAPKLSPRYAEAVRNTGQDFRTSLRNLFALARDTVDECTRERLRNCGAYIELPWLGEIAAIYRSAYSTGRSPRDVCFTEDAEIETVFLQFLTSVRNSADLLDGTQVWKEFNVLLQLLARPSLEFTTRQPFLTLQADVRMLEERSWETKLVSTIDIFACTSFLRRNDRESSGLETARRGSPLGFASKPRAELLEQLTHICYYPFLIPSQYYNEFYGICVELWHRCADTGECHVPEFKTLLQFLGRAVAPSLIPSPTRQSMLFFVRRGTSASKLLTETETATSPSHAAESSHNPPPPTVSPAETSGRSQAVFGTDDAAGIRRDETQIRDFTSDTVDLSAAPRAVLLPTTSSRPLEASIVHVSANPSTSSGAVAPSAAGSCLPKALENETEHSRQATGDDNADPHDASDTRPSDQEARMM